MRSASSIVLALLLLIGSVHFGGAGPLATGTPSPPAPSTVKSNPEKKKGQSSEVSDSAKAADDTKKGINGLGPIGVFADIEDGWQKEKVQAILKHFGKAKVDISIEGIGPTNGSFSKNQSHYLFKDLFKYTITEKFEFVQYRNVTDGRVKAYAVAERSFKRNDDGRLIEDKIYVSLHLEDDRWVISEIKSIR